MFVQRMGLLELERDSLLDKLVDYNKMLHGMRLEKEQLQKQLKVRCRGNDSLRRCSCRAHNAHANTGVCCWP